MTTCTFDTMSSLFILHVFTTDEAISQSHTIRVMERTVLCHCFIASTSSAHELKYRRPQPQPLPSREQTTVESYSRTSLSSLGVVDIIKKSIKFELSQSRQQRRPIVYHVACRMFIKETDPDLLKTPWNFSGIISLFPSRGWKERETLSRPPPWRCRRWQQRRGQPQRQPQRARHRPPRC